MSARDKRVRRSIENKFRNSIPFYHYTSKYDSVKGEFLVQTVQIFRPLTMFIFSIQYIHSQIFDKFWKHKCASIVRKMRSIEAVSSKWMAKSLNAIQEQR